MKNLYLLPTDKSSRLFLSKISNKLLFLKNETRFDIFPIGLYQNIYITSDEEIKEGDWFVVKLFKITGESDGFHIEKCTKLNDVWCNNFDVISIRHKDNCKKIILTTDIDLINDGVQPIDDDFLEWYINNPSCEEVKVKKEFDEDWDEGGGAYGIDYYKIIIPKEESKLDLVSLSDSLDTALKIETKESLTEWLKNERKETTLEEAAEKYRQFWLENKITINQIFEAGAKWQKELTYTEEDIKSFGWYSTKYGTLQGNRDVLFQEWFEQFKKK